MALSVRSPALKSIRAVTLLAVAGVVAIPGLAKADETWTPGTMLTVSNLTSFDIGWVDYSNPGTLGIAHYFLADRSNKAIDAWSIPAANGGLVQYTANFVGAFVGPTGAVNNDLSGPNGVLTVPFNNSGHTEIWAGDGPQVTIGCPAFLGGKCSSVKVIDANTAGLVAVIPTGGAARADELCFDYDDELVMIANDAEADFSFGTPFISVISTQGPFAYQVVANMQIPQTTNGIEQCRYDHQLGLFFINIPEVGGHGADTADGQVLVLKVTPPGAGPTNNAKITELGAFIIPNNNCAGPQGMAIANPFPFAGATSTNPQMLLGCNAVSLNGPFAGLRNSVIINKFTGAIIATGPGLGGADEVWSNDTTYYVTGSSCTAGTCDQDGPQFGMVDFGAPVSPSTDQIIAITPIGGVSSHSIAADCNFPLGGSLGTGQVFLPVAGGVQVFNPPNPRPPATTTPCLNP
jgi:hypothetical protein